MLRFNAELGAASLAAHRSYQAGERVCSSFGPSLSPCDLLLDYGFVDSRFVCARAEAQRGKGNWMCAWAAAAVRGALLSALY